MGPNPNFEGKDLVSIPEEMARQMALIEHGYFQKITLVDCLNYKPKEKEKEDEEGIIFISHFNKMSSWISSEIVKEHDDEKRLILLKNFIQLARMCRKLNNFNGFMEVISGLNSSAVRKLEETWQALPKKDLTTVEAYELFIQRKGNYAEYRKALLEVTLPCLPYFGVFLTDLTFIRDGNQDFVGHGKINFAKRWKMYCVISQMEKYQTTPFPYQEVPEIRKFLENVQPIEENERYGMAKRMSDLHKAASALKNSSTKLATFWRNGN